MNRHAAYSPIFSLSPNYTSCRNKTNLEQRILDIYYTVFLFHSSDVSISLDVDVEKSKSFPLFRFSSKSSKETPAFRQGRNWEQTFLNSSVNLLLALDGMHSATSGAVWRKPFRLEQAVATSTVKCRLRLVRLTSTSRTRSVPRNGRPIGNQPFNENWKCKPLHSCGGS